jgi:hypothetical protein
MITGVPGSGKTYYAVKELLSNYYTDNKDGSYTIAKDLKVISNIENLLLDHLSLEEEIETFIDMMVQDHCRESDICDLKEIEETRWNFRNDKIKYFEKDHQEKIAARHGRVVYVIDECQEYFSTKMHRFRYARNVFMWFETHRHLGQDVILITQSSMKVARDIRDLVEYEIRALPKSLSLFGEMKYNEYTNGMKSNALPKSIRPKKNIFQLYKSMSMKGSEKSGSALKTIFIMMMVGLVLGGSFLYFGIFKKYGKAEIPEKPAVVINSEVNKNSMEVKKVDFHIESIWFPVSWTLENNDVRSINVYDELNNLLLPISMWNREIKVVGQTMYAEFTMNEISIIMEMRTEQADPQDGAAAESHADPPVQSVIESEIQEISN